MRRLSLYTDGDERIAAKQPRAGYRQRAGDRLKIESVPCARGVVSGLQPFCSRMNRQTPRGRPRRATDQARKPKRAERGTTDAKNWRWAPGSFRQRGRLVGQIPCGCRGSALAWLKLARSGWRRCRPVSRLIKRFILRVAETGRDLPHCRRAGGRLAAALVARSGRERITSAIQSPQQRPARKLKQQHAEPG